MLRLLRSSSLAVLGISEYIFRSGGRGGSTAPGNLCTGSAESGVDGELHGEWNDMVVDGRI